MSESRSEPNEKLYLMIAGALFVLTIISYVGDLMHPPRPALIALVLTVAVVKASLVASVFMHLKFEWGKVKVMIIPAIILSAVLVFALLPDITYALRANATVSPKSPVHTPAAAHGDSAKH